MESQLQEIETEMTATGEFSFTTGPAGSGKTYQCKQAIEADPRWGMLTSTTGISAINLGTITLNSALGYFDTEALEKSQVEGKLLAKLIEIREGYRRLVIDEISMMDGRQLTIISQEIDRCNDKPGNAPPLGLYLTGDMLQLPPVKAPWAFESKEWPRFEKNTNCLTKIWRQDSGPFLNALNFARSGNGRMAADILSQEGVQWNRDPDHDFNGTTIMAKNDAVAEFNQKAMDQLKTRPFVLQNRRWGAQQTEFKQIPDQLTLKPGCMVMLLSNHFNGPEMVYANGDLGTVLDFDGWCLRVRLIRNSQIVDVEKVLRNVGPNRKPKTFSRLQYGDDGWTPYRHWNPGKGKYVEGQLEWWPIRVAYASTVHKAQGLTLDAVQFDFRDQFTSSPALVYVALSRCRTLEGLRLVGDQDRFIRYCNIDPKVKRWL